MQTFVTEIFNSTKLKEVEDKEVGHQSKNVDKFAAL
jgi:hypothetical protein